eukprot:NODE_1196_length_1054_cov_91.910448_g927_i0.p3 GENE.NODE_1196_length_1054_cov_91.910448_g927_i0~~NODE_1196_length_1054_cov_91.910448_g927_i0.p3  ORF type:complete len:73 (-),score=16.89 NODE_1196_length_1054_cov_91.910448_g927_i0:460-678(-)
MLVLKPSIVQHPTHTTTVHTHKSTTVLRTHTHTTLFKSFSVRKSMDTISNILLKIETVSLRVMMSVERGGVL